MSFLNCQQVQKSYPECKFGVNHLVDSQCYLMVHYLLGRFQCHVLIRNSYEDVFLDRKSLYSQLLELVTSIFFLSCSSVMGPSLPLDNNTVSFFNFLHQCSFRSASSSCCSVNPDPTIAPNLHSCLIFTVVAIPSQSVLYLILHWKKI